MQTRSKYLDSCTAEQRAVLTAPSRPLVQMVDFIAAYRASHPGATMGEAVTEYVATERAKFAARFQE